MNTQTLFLGFVAGLALAIVLVASWRLPRRTATVATIGLAVWLAYVGVLSRSGLIADPALRPPAILYVVGPVILFVMFGVIRSGLAGRVALAVPLWLLIGLQGYRVGVELFLHQLWHEGVVPRMLTFEGANVDIWIGASAPIVAWLATSGRGGRRIATAWSVAGLLALANVIVRSALTAPGPLHLLATETANRAIGTFPYTYIAGFLAPLAVTLHVLALRALAGTATTDAPPGPFPEPDRIVRMNAQAEAVRTHYQAGIEDRDALLGRIAAAVEAMEPPIDSRRLAPLDQFHMGGLAATTAVAARVGVPAGAAVLDAGSGLGGPARYLAETFGCRVAGVDLSPDYVAIARLLTERAGLADRVTFQEGDLLRLPFEDGRFDLVWTQHVAMNIADRAGLYRELRRVLKHGGRLAFYDPLAADGHPALTYPVPWAQTAETSTLLTAGETRDVLGQAGFHVLSLDDVTQEAMGWAQQGGPPQPGGRERDDDRGRAHGRDGREFRAQPARGPRAPDGRRGLEWRRGMTASFPAVAATTGGALLVLQMLLALAVSGARGRGGRLDRHRGRPQARAYRTAAREPGRERRIVPRRLHVAGALGTLADIAPAPVRVLRRAAPVSCHRPVAREHQQSAPADRRRRHLPPRPDPGRGTGLAGCHGAGGPPWLSTTRMMGRRRSAKQSW